jgi:hypothetical protein
VGHPQNRPRTTAPEVLRKLCGILWTHIECRKQPVGQQLICDRRAGRYEDGALNDEGKTSVGFNLFDRHKQERTGKGYRQEIKTC